MSGNRTFTMIKPDAVEKTFGGAIFKQIQEAGFKIIAMKQTQLTLNRHANFITYIASDHSITTFVLL